MKIKNYVTLILAIVGLSLQAQNKIYLTEIGNDRLYRCNTDGSQIEDLDIDVFLNHPEDIAYDSASNRIYWTDHFFNIVTGNEVGFVGYAALDGSDTQLIELPDSRPRKIFLDKISNQIYWSDDISEKIWMADLNLENIVFIGSDTTFSGVHSFDIDFEEGIIFWNTHQSDQIWKANLDGSSTSLIYESDVNLGMVKLDIENQLIYSVSNEEGIIFRMDYLGQNQEVLITDLANVNVFDIDFLNQRIFWSDNYVNGGNFESACLKSASLITWETEEIETDIPNPVFFGIHLDITEEEIPTSLTKEVDSKKSIDIYPNPYTNMIYVQGIEEINKYEIFNQKGELVVVNTETSNIIEEDILPAGIYFVRFTFNDKVITKKIRKK